MSTKLETKLAALLSVLLVGALVAVGYLAWRQVHNDTICQRAIGTGATWDGGNRCRPAAVIVEGVLQ